MNPLKLFSTAIACCLLVTTSFGQMALASANHNKYSRQQVKTTDVDADWYAKASKHIEELGQAFYPEDNTGGFRAVNIDNGITFTFTPTGYTAHNIIRQMDEQIWKAGFQISGLGRKTIQWKPGQQYTFKNDQGILTYQFNNVDIQYVNNKNGLRQNFIIKKKIAGADMLKMHIKLDGNVIPQLVSNTRVAFHTAEHPQVTNLVYEDLKVWDAHHQALNAAFHLQGNMLTIDVDDSKAAYPITIDPVNQSPEWNTSANGVAASLLNNTQLNTALYGYTVTGVGDVNGDGFGDVAISAPGMADVFSGTGTLAAVGAVFVFYGNGTNISTTPAKTLQPNTAVAGALFGTSVDAGDVTGDGVNDIVVGAPLDRINLVVGILPINGTVGKVYVYPGGSNAAANPSNFLTLQLNTSQVGLLNISVNALFGFSVAVTDDLNNDGKKDIVVGSPAFSPALSILVKTGGAFVFLTSSGNSFSIQSLSAPTFSLLGISIPLLNNIDGLLFGYSVDGAGDYNGDGKPDIVVGAPAGVDLSSLTNIVNGQILGGQALVYYGKTNNTGVTTTVGARLQAASSGLLGNAANLFGFKVKGMRNTNGTRNGNIMVGAPLGGLIPNTLGLTIQTGSAHLFKKKNTSPASPVTSDQQLESPRSSSVLQLLNTMQLNLLFGASFDNAYDVNCDGYPDLVVGEPLSSGTNLLQLQTNAVGGAVYIYEGDGAGGYVPTPQYSVQSTYGSDILSVNATALFGFSVTAIKDVKGPGSTPRLLVGSPSGALDFNGLLNLGSTLGTVLNFAAGNNGPGKAYTFEPSLCGSNQHTLPVTLVSFTGKQKEKAIALDWKTTAEINVDRYEVERSSDGLNFETIALVFSNDNSPTNDYSFTDKQPFATINYYRLNMIDKDGRHSYSNVITFRFGQTTAGNVMIAPNPATENIHIILNGLQNGDYRVEIRNTIGQLQQAKTINVTQQHQEENIYRNASMTGGFYWLTIYDKNNTRISSNKVLVK